MLSFECIECHCLKCVCVRLFQSNWLHESNISVMLLCFCFCFVFVLEQFLFLWFSLSFPLKCPTSDRFQIEWMKWTIWRRPTTLNWTIYFFSRFNLTHAHIHSMFGPSVCLCVWLQIKINMQSELLNIRESLLLLFITQTMKSDQNPKWFLLNELWSIATIATGTSATAVTAVAANRKQ